MTEPGGTDILVEPSDREWQIDSGIVHEEEEMTNLPADETFVSPVTAEGTFVIDRSMLSFGLLGPDESITVGVEGSTVTDISDPEVRQDVEVAAETAGEAAYNLTELIIGANVGIGAGTEAPLHVDCVIRDSTVIVDGTEIELPKIVFLRGTVEFSRDTP